MAATKVNRHLIVFTRYPQPGTTKTRLIPALGAAGAARLQRTLTRHTLDWARELSAARVEVRYEGPGAAAMARAFGDDLIYTPQNGSDLGARMDRAFQDAFGAGARAVVTVGTDCPGLTAAVARAAFAGLEHADLVLGPATDGGYYLIGLKRPTPGLFAAMPWGTDTVLECTRERARALSLSVVELPELSDVDRPEDLPVWEAVQREHYPERISVVIPALNEAPHIQKAVASALDAANVEALVVDGGSQDDTAILAEQAGAQVLHCAPGRALQLNAGAAAASGSILLFLHADSLLPENYDIEVRRILQEPGVACGAFRFHLATPGLRFRLIEWGTNLRARYLQLPYGDQALFLKTPVFRSLGGFGQLPIMEDFDLVRRLSRRGRIAILPSAVVTSARRWRALGSLRTLWVNQLVIAGYFLGVRPERLARWYRAAAPRRR